MTLVWRSPERGAIYHAYRYPAAPPLRPPTAAMKPRCIPGEQAPCSRNSVLKLSEPVVTARRRVDRETAGTIERKLIEPPRVPPPAPQPCSVVFDRRIKWPPGCRICRGGRRGRRKDEGRADRFCLFICLGNEVTSGEANLIIRPRRYRVYLTQMSIRPFTELQQPRLWTFPPWFLLA